MIGHYPRILRQMSGSDTLKLVVRFSDNVGPYYTICLSIILLLVGPLGLQFYNMMEWQIEEPSFFI